MANPAAQFFRDQQGQPIKFFIAKDIDQKRQTALYETIANHGGRVEGKVPRAGYLLVEQNTVEDNRLRACWQAPDRPDRHFVPHLWVDACVSAGQLLHQIFARNGVPLRMHIHSSIANVNVRNTLCSRIVYSGGDPYGTEANADVILADPNTPVWQTIVRDYQAVPEKYIESFLWVKKSIERGVATFTSYVYKNPGGRRAGDERMPFTSEDDEQLCQWIALKIPYKNSGGRTGNKVYQQLLEKTDLPGYEWVGRHTWQSWRERYKKNADRLDVRIAEIVEERNVVPGEKGQYAYVRAAENNDEERAPRPRKKRRTGAAVVEDPDLEQELAFADQRLSDGALSPTPELPPPQMAFIDPQLAGLGVPGVTAATAPGFFISHPPMVPDMPLQSHAGTVDQSGESQWPIRIGSDPPPRWATNGQHTEVGATAQAEPSAEAHLELARIATSTRFTMEEVAEYHGRCGYDLKRTRERFQRAREVLMDHFARED